MICDTDEYLVDLYSEWLELRHAAGRLHDCLQGLLEAERSRRLTYAGESFDAEAARDYQRALAAELRIIHTALLDLHDKATGDVIHSALETEWCGDNDGFLRVCGRAVNRIVGQTMQVARNTQKGQMEIEDYLLCLDHMVLLLPEIDEGLERLKSLQAVKKHLARKSLKGLREQIAIETSPVAAETEVADAAPDDGVVGGAADQPHSNGKAPESVETRPEGGESKRRSSGEWLPAAMLLLTRHPEWPDARIAKKAGCHPGTLSRSEHYQEAARVARKPKKALPKGEKFGDAFEAVAPQESPDRYADRGQPILNSRFVREYCATCDEPIGVTADQVGNSPVCAKCQ